VRNKIRAAQVLIDKRVAEKAAHDAATRRAGAAVTLQMWTLQQVYRKRQQRDARRRYMASVACVKRALRRYAHSLVVLREKRAQAVVAARRNVAAVVRGWRDCHIATFAAFIALLRVLNDYVCVCVHVCVQPIQALWRGHHLRRGMRRLTRACRLAKGPMQRVQRSSVRMKMQAKLMLLSKSSAVRRIQAAFRGYRFATLVWCCRVCECRRLITAGR
jgi:hypothetical protein